MRMTQHPRTYGSDQETRPKNAQDEEGTEINTKGIGCLFNDILVGSSTTRGIQNPEQT